MMSPEVGETHESVTLQQNTHNSVHNEPVSVSVGKVDEVGDLSISIGNQEFSLSMYQTPDLSERDAKKVCEMFAEELAESVSESKYVELPPLRVMKETAKASNINNRLLSSMLISRSWRSMSRCKTPWRMLMT